MNNNRILIRRGTNDNLVTSEDNIAFGQPVYNNDLNYLTIGSYKLNNSTKITTDYKNLKPIRVRELFGYYKDNLQLGELNSSADFFKISGENDNLDLTSSTKINLKSKSTDSIAIDGGNVSIKALLNVPKVSTSSLANNSGTVLIALNMNNISVSKPLVLSDSLKLSAVIDNNPNIINNMYLGGTLKVSDVLTAEKNIIINGTGLTGDVLSVTGKGYFSSDLKTATKISSPLVNSIDINNAEKITTKSLETISLTVIDENVQVKLKSGKTFKVLDKNNNECLKIDSNGNVIIKNLSVTTAKVTNLTVTDLNL